MNLAAAKRLTAHINYFFPIVIVENGEIELVEPDVAGETRPLRCEIELVEMFIAIRHDIKDVAMSDRAAATRTPQSLGSFILTSLCHIIAAKLLTPD
jgi:hypothetical protein